MVKKQQKTAAPKQAQGRRKAATPASTSAADTPFAEQVRTSAQQIWSAGLAAFAKAQERGGASVDTAAPAPDAAARRLSDLAGEVGSRAGQHWDKLESIFEDRVARALERLGMPAPGEVAQLKARVLALEAEVALLRAAQGLTARKPAARRVTAAQSSKATTPSPVAKTATAGSRAAKTARTAKTSKTAKGGKRTT